MTTPVKILIVDDDPYIVEMYLTKFKEVSDFQVDIATNGREALEKIDSLKPDVVLLDIIMPIYDGFEVLKKLKETNKLSSTKVVVLSNLGQREDVERGLSLGAVDYIIKAHFTPSEVVEKVRAILKI